ncbi:hypothetical protein Leryth_023135 [Lithospermum erythrorhizon]|nr:hypothetical protein Leryth_023135 [Lithospermum erythrorhizon]
MGWFAFQIFDVLIMSDESLKKLLSGCLSLKTLYILRGCNDCVVTLTVRSPTLEHLTITIYGRELNYDDTHEEECIKLELDVPALKYLCIHDKMVNDISVEDMPSLVEVKIRLSLQFFEKQLGCNWSGIDNIFRSIGSMKLLSLDEFTMMALSHSGLSPKLERLANLTLTVGCCKWSSLQGLLEVSDSLEYLALNIVLYFDDEHQHETCWTKPKKMAACLSCLKEMSVEGFSGRDDELAMLSYILQNASLLETMKITASSSLNLRKNHKLLQKVSKFRRASTMCEVIFR